ncbi:hypothetical protein NEOLEDRAFT_1181442 [Neolentinus lepideus HHB14362 ss-1]|uniref:Uncharacterized protein n=1 Tax=Neolentinus lepideus HHB14362 ss-1 TaxID=1314782 RepID=A0A165Q0Z5_9AGAM|nr:hypothetical protein NEOLEDRAFT_1181442 [Neolentinus lepideus HHB14362 ss-1]
MVASINVDVAELAGLIVESIFYGIFVILFVAAIYLTFMRRRHAKINPIMVLVAIAMSILVTVQLVGDTTNVFLAFINRDRAGRIAFMQDVTQPVFILRHTTLILMILVSDSFVTYRCWVVWNKKIWVVILPICLSLGSGVAGFHAIWSFGNFKAETRVNQEKWLIAISSLSLAANAVSTSIYIWNKNSKAAQIAGSTSSLMPVVKLVIESGALNAGYMLANTITLVTGTEGLETMAEMGTPLIGCIFLLVIIRVCINSREDPTSDNQKSSLALRTFSGSSVEAARERERRSGAQGRQIVIEREVFVTQDEGGEVLDKDPNGKSHSTFVV